MGTVPVIGGQSLSRPASHFSTLWANFCQLLAAHHDFRRLDDRDGFVATPQLELAYGVAGDHRGQHLVADAQTHLGQQPIGADFVDNAAQLIAAAEGDEDAVRGAGARPLRQRAARGQQALDLFRGDAVMPPSVRTVRMRLGESTASASSR